MQNADLNREYSGYLQTRPFSEQEVETAKDLASEYGLTLDITRTSVDFDYSGRDSNRFVLKFLIRLAEVVIDAEGEIRCQVEGDTDELWFEFFRIRNGKLYRQIAELVRGKEEEIAEVR